MRYSMAWDYLVCSKEHVYRVRKTKHKRVLKTTCPFCGSAWEYKTTKAKWRAWREQHFKYHGK